MFRIGDSVVVVRLDKLYSTWSVWARCMGLTNFIHAATPIEGDTGIVIAVGTNSAGTAKVAGISVGDIDYIIGFDGLRLE